MEKSPKAHNKWVPKTLKNLEGLGIVILKSNKMEIFNKKKNQTSPNIGSPSTQGIE